MHNLNTFSLIAFVIIKYLYTTIFRNIEPPCTLAEKNLAHRHQIENLMSMTVLSDMYITSIIVDATAYFCSIVISSQQFSGSSKGLVSTRFFFFERNSSD